MRDADRIIFMGTSFSLNITYMALEIARKQKMSIEIIDPKPVNIPYPNATIHTMTASTYINQVEKGDLT